MCTIRMKRVSCYLMVEGGTASKKSERKNGKKAGGGKKGDLKMCLRQESERMRQIGDYNKNNNEDEWGRNTFSE